MIILSLALIFGVSYALWQITLKQETTNRITTGCFNVEFSDQNPITLENAYPISDEEGRKLTPYTFTITNTCDTLVKYQVNLDILNTTTLNNHSYVQTTFNENSPRTLSETEIVNKTVENASTLII